MKDEDMADEYSVVHVSRICRAEALAKAGHVSRFTLHAPRSTLHALRLPPRHPRPVERCAAKFLEPVLDREFLHDRKPEIGFGRGWVFEVAVGLMNADKLRAFLEFFFGSHIRLIVEG